MRLFAGRQKGAQLAHIRIFLNGDSPVFGQVVSAMRDAGAKSTAVSVAINFGAVSANNSLNVSAWVTPKIPSRDWACEIMPRLIAWVFAGEALVFARQISCANQPS